MVHITGVAGTHIQNFRIFSCVLTDDVTEGLPILIPVKGVWVPTVKERFTQHIAFPKTQSSHSGYSFSNTFKNICNGASKVNFSCFTDHGGDKGARETPKDREPQAD